MEKENTNNFIEDTPVNDDLDDNISIESQKSDTKENDIDLNISKARDRTFNKELSDLVEKIRSNEPADTLESSSEDNILTGKEQAIEVEKQNLLQMFHQLFYKSVNLAGIENINTAFNPFDLYKLSSSDDLLNLINNEMCGLLLSEYSILAYNLEKKCFTCYANYIEILNKDNIIIDTSEDIFTRIINNNFTLINHQTIERDIYLKKRFKPIKEKDININFLFISFNNIYKNFYDNRETDDTTNFTNSFFPVLMILINKAIIEPQIKGIYQKINDKLAVLLFLLHKKILIETHKENSIDLHNVFDTLDYSYRKYNIDNNCLCAIFKIKYYKNIESLFILNYLQIKLNNRLPGQADVSRLEKDKLILFTLKSKKKIIDEIIDDLKKYYNNLFQVELFINDELNNKISLINTIKQYLVK